MQWQNDPERITYFAATHTRGKRRAFGIRAKDRLMHLYTIGKSGMGKSTMLENMAIQDIQNGEGIAFVDPHGSTADKLLDFIPEERIKDVVYIAPFDTEYPVGFNIMEDVGYENRHKVVAGLMGVFHRLWEDQWSARMEYILQNTLLALLEYPGSTIIDVNRMLVNKAFRADVIKHITDPVVESFWKEEFATYTDRYTAEATPAIQNKIGQFVSNPLIRNIVGQPKSAFDMRKVMDERKILIVNLSKGRVGEANAAILGSVMVIKIYLAALSRADEPAARMNALPPYYFYVDEFQNVVNNAFENILSEARKYKLGLVVAHQYIEQMSEEVRNAVFGNVGTTVIFRVGPQDAEFLKTIFEPTFTAEDMVELGRGQIYLSLMIDGVGSQPFSADTLPPIEAPPSSFREEIIEHTRETYGRSRAAVEKVVREANDRWREAAVSKHKEASAKGPQNQPNQSGHRGQQGARQQPQQKGGQSAKRPAPPKASAQSPIDTLRAKQQEKQYVKKEKPYTPPKAEDKKERNALRDAISKATDGQDAAKPQQPSAAAAPQKPTHKPQISSNGEVSPETLERLLNGDD